MTVPERSDDLLGLQLTIDDVLVLEELARVDGCMEDYDALTCYHLMSAFYRLHPELPGAPRYGYLVTPREL